MHLLIIAFTVPKESYYFLAE